MTITNNLPRPENTTVYLESNGYPPKHATLHIYVETRETEIAGPRGEAYEFIFKCTETGAERRYGLVERYVFSIDEGN